MTLTNTFGNYQNEFGRAYEDGRHGLHYMNKEIPRMLNDVNLRSDFMKAVSDMKERNFVDENNIRMMMLGTSIAQGMLSGYTINSRYLEAQPLPFITPMVMSFGYAGIVDEAKGDRRMLISAALGAPLCANFLLGAFYGKLITSYNFLSLGYTAIGGIIMQLLFHKAHDKRGHIYQNMLNASFLLFKGLTFYLFGTYVE
uniref:MFS transporter n=1 Tax=Angiostrongylus cantonensis TaxID=6313 RepID=A0A0K0DMW8_ANGCA